MNNQNSTIAQGALTPLGMAEREINILKNALQLGQDQYNRLAEEKNRLDSENMRLGNEIRVNHSDYERKFDAQLEEITRLQNEVNELQGRLFNASVERLECAAAGLGVDPRPMVYPDFSNEKAVYEGLQKQRDKKAEYDTQLVAFNDGSYKKMQVKDWKHSQWIHFTRPNGKVVRINPANVNYIEEV